MEQKLADKIAEMRDYMDEIERSLPSIVKLRKMMKGDLKCNAKIFHSAAKSLGYIHQMTVNVNYSCIMYITHAPFSAFGEYDNETIQARESIMIEMSKDTDIIKKMLDLTYPIIEDFAKIDPKSRVGEISTKAIDKYILDNKLNCGD